MLWDDKFRVMKITKNGGAVHYEIHQKLTTPCGTNTSWHQIRGGRYESLKGATKDAQRMFDETIKSQEVVAS